MNRLWKFNQIKKSIDNPVEIAEIDEKIDNLMVKIQEVEIGIKKGYTEIEFICVDVEGCGGTGKYYLKKFSVYTCY